MLPSAQGSLTAEGNAITWKFLGTVLAVPCHMGTVGRGHSRCYFVPGDPQRETAQPNGADELRAVAL